MDDAAAEVRATLEAATQARLRLPDLRTPHPVAAHLSGGIDSSTVAVLAARELRARGLPPPLTFSWQGTPPSPDQAAAMEFAAIDWVLAQEALPHVRVDIPVALAERRLLDDICLHHNASFWSEDQVRATAQTQGVRVLLSGWGGDELISFNGRGYLSDLLYTGQWRELARRIWRGAGRRGPNRLRHLLGIIRQHLLLPALPDALYWRLPGMGPEPVSHPCHGPALRHHLAQLPPLRQRDRAGVRATQRMLLAYGHLHQRMEGWAAAGADVGLVYRYPLLDRRMVELALRLPAEAYVHQGHARYLYRRAIEDLLPAEIVWGNLKVEPARVRELLRVNHAALPAVLDALLPAPTDWVDGACLRQQAATLQPDDLPGISKTSHLAQILAAGRQLAHLPTRPADAP
jgi:asparagine synthase (glutamine-hydrolysing)